jgi:hypothetical protein
MNMRHLYLLAGLLATVALATFAYKALVLGFPLLPDARSEFWNLEVSMEFTPWDEPVQVSLQIPESSSRFAIMDENFISRGYGLMTRRTDSGRQVVWSSRMDEGEKTLYYRARIRRLPAGVVGVQPPPPEVGAPELDEVSGPVADAIIEEVRARSADTESLTRELLARLHRPQPDENVALLLGEAPTGLRAMSVAARLLVRAGIPARVVHGIRLQQQRQVLAPVHWLEVLIEDRWWGFVGAAGDSVPDEFFPWWRGDQPPVRFRGVTSHSYRFAISHSAETAVTAAIEGGRIKHPLLAEFSLFRLPLETQAIYQILLMVPLGVLLLVIMRNVIGVKTFGTFMPVLIALAFRETQLLWGIVLFCVVVGLGLAARLYLERLRLLMVPRLASVLIVVILLMALLSLLSHRMGLERGLSVALFPMVILAMTIERMSIVWEERGAAEAFRQGMGSLFVAILAYGVMTRETLEHLMFVFPELLLLILAATLLLGRYTGYRLLELYRFRVLARE